MSTPKYQAVNPFSLPSLPLSDRYRLPKRPGLYFILSGNKVLYVGRSRNIFNRWLNHHRYKQVAEFSDVRVAFWGVEPESRLPQVEARAIAQLKPVLNNTPLNA